MKPDIEIDFLDDKPVSEYDWQQVEQAPNLTPGNVAWCGVIGVVLFGLGFAILAALMIL